MDWKFNIYRKFLCAMYVLNTIFYNVFFCIHYLSGRMIFLSCKCFNRKENKIKSIFYSNVNSTTVQEVLWCLKLFFVAYLINKLAWLLREKKVMILQWILTLIFAVRKHTHTVLKNRPVQIRDIEKEHS